MLKNKCMIELMFKSENFEFMDGCDCEHKRNSRIIYIMFSAYMISTALFSVVFLCLLLL